MSRLADRAKSYPLASFGAALLPPELGGPLPAQFVQRVDRYVTRLPATSRFAVRAGLASLAAASYLTTGRSLPRLHPDERARVLHRIAALSPEVAAAVEGLKAIVLLANGADTYAHELLARAQEHDAARPDAVMSSILSADSPSVTRADAVVVGSGAGGAMVARSWPGPALTWSCSKRDGAGRSRSSVAPTRSTVMPGCTVAPGPPSRSGDGGGAADGPGGGRHHRRQLRHLLSAFTCRAAALA
ncbi:oxidoreductase GMC-type [Mycobacterium tuberculosis CAS/NITR204]|uniref:Oxidoreductase GMC-type n=1 Tax=Mycobacterium tuberculosis CAS/NITR204 TaxID=1310114 RepID=R4M2W0_MYCTX|nr:oxidoreductase GMC-type [Mycobacterium tuberculosis CAS/NITR204]